MKLILTLFLLSYIHLYSQEIPLDSSNFENYIKEVYLDKAELLIFSNPEQLKKKKRILDRVFIINNVEKKKESFKDFNTLYVINTYNKSLKQDLPEYIDASKFNPFLYKIDVYNSETVYYYYAKSKQLIKVYPSTK